MRDGPKTSQEMLMNRSDVGAYESCAYRLSSCFDKQ
jgi:hypothetical protein